MSRLGEVGKTKPRVLFSLAWRDWRENMSDGTGCTPGDKIVVLFFELSVGNTEGNQSCGYIWLVGRE